MIKLTRPLTFLDFETTTAKASTARIVSLCMIKLNPDMSIEHRSMMINPGGPIPKESTDVHGITDEMVKDCPLFSQVAQDIVQFILGTDLSGYNLSTFDVPILIEELLRCGIDFDLKDVLIFDSCTIFKKKEERNLAAALKFFTGETLDDAHSADADTKAAMKVLLAQLQYYPELGEMSLEELAEYCKFEGQERIDLAGVFLKDDDGDAVYAFGKHKGKKVRTELGYLKWLLGDEGYSLQTKKVGQKMYDYYSKKK